MSSRQQDATREVVRSVQEFLGGPNREEDEWRFEFGPHLYSNWGAVYGGALSAALLAVARSEMPDRSPRSMHIQMVRSVPSGQAFASAMVRHPGRTVATIEVDLYDERRKLAAVALFTMVAPDAVAAELHRTSAAPPFRTVEIPVAGVHSGAAAGIVTTLEMNTRFIRAGTLPFAESVRPSVDGTLASIMECTVPWDDLEVTGPEAACLAADAIIAAPILQSFVPDEALGPNPDLSLRFSTAPAARVIVAASSMLSVQQGTATIGIEVQAGDDQLAHGLATSLLVPSS